MVAVRRIATDGAVARAMMAKSSRLADYTVMVLAVVCGGGSLVLFFLWPFEAVCLRLGETGILIWDGLLSIAFFLQHSVMVRAPVRDRLASLLPERYVGALYSIASGVVLALVLLLWQRSPTMLLSVEGPARWLTRTVAVLGLAGFAWGVASLHDFDPFGLRPIKVHLRGATRRGSTFTVRGAYRWVRHPLYSSVLLLFWANPDVTADRLLFDALWTAWIAFATTLEERDLVVEFGDVYRRYRRNVPMLIPWHAPRAAQRDVPDS